MVSGVGFIRRRIAGDFQIDEWGLDPELASIGGTLLGLRWSIEVDGAFRIPANGPALLVFNQRLGTSEPFVVGRGVATEIGRFVRVAGVPDVAMIGPALRRLGGVLGGVDEVASLLHAGHVVAVGLSRRPLSRRDVGSVDVRHLVTARRFDAPVLPVALEGAEHGRRWRVEVGEAVTDPSGGNLGETRLAEAVRSAVADLRRPGDHSIADGCRLRRYLSS